MTNLKPRTESTELPSHITNHEENVMFIVNIFQEKGFHVHAVICFHGDRLTADKF